MDYKQKYLKYKQKYLELKNQTGGKSRKDILIETINEALRLNGGNIPITFLTGSLFLQKLNIIKPFNQETSIYTFLGHGCDEENKLEIVPKNCMYIHAAKCGRPHYFFDNFKNFPCLFSKNDECLKDPIKYIHNLNDADFDLLIDNAGTNYINNRFNTYMFPERGTLSGLVKIGSNIGEISDWDPNECDFYPRSIGSAFDFIDDLDAAHKVYEYFINQYDVSLFPLKKDVRNMLEHEDFLTKLNDIISKKFSDDLEYNFELKIRCCAEEFQKLMNKYFKVDIKSLFKYFPGIYYSISCRIPCPTKYGENQDTDYTDESNIPKYFKDRNKREQARIRRIIK